MNSDKAKMSSQSGSDVMKNNPHFIVPTRSCGVGIEYRINGTVTYYHLVRGIMDFTLIEDNHVSKQVFFTDLAEAPALLK